MQFLVGFLLGCLMSSPKPEPVANDPNDLGMAVLACLMLALVLFIIGVQVYQAVKEHLDDKRRPEA